MTNPESFFFDTSQYHNSQDYVLDCINSGFAGRVGKYVDGCASFINNMYHADCILVSNGTVALELALRTIGIKEGDIVLVPNISFVATANSVIEVGGTPLFLDNMANDVFPDLSSIEDVLKQKKPKAIIIVNLYGVPAPHLQELRLLCDKYNVILIEDNAQSFGSYYDNSTPVGCYGDMTTFSFFSNKTIACGQGGAVVFNNKSLFPKAHAISNHGRLGECYSGYGGNYSLNNLSAALLLGMLERMSDILALRNRVYHSYLDLIRDLNLNVVAYRIKENYAKWVLPLKIHVEPTKIVRNLTKKGIACRLGMSFLPELPHYNQTDRKYNGVRPDDILLPIHTGLTEADVKKILIALKVELS